MNETSLNIPVKFDGTNFFILLLNHIDAAKIVG